MELLDVSPVQGDIKYKQINTEDFEPYGYTVSKEIITPNEKGYISDQIQAVFQFEEPNTVVINAGVGQGKTHTVMQIAKKYYDEGYLLVFAVPYIVLIDQYRKELVEKQHISDNNIFDYQKLKEAREDYSSNEDDNNSETKLLSPQDASLKNIHLLTINCLLGNPGENFHEQSKAKSEYMQFIIDRCKNENKKVLLIMDEIHDGIHNFEQHFIFNLWKWKPILHKILTVSATFNEAAKIVIKYLAELTNNTIQIIESKRTKVEPKQSDLFLLLYNKHKYDVEDGQLVSMFNELISKDKIINVLSYSKTVSNEIADSEKKIGNLLHNKYGSENINLCTGDSKNAFEPGKCNIGTTFSTGINIEGHDSAFVVLLPTINLWEVKNIAERRSTGIFSRGINTLIQALARVRDKSEIYIILPAPKYLIYYSSSANDSYVNIIKSIPFLGERRIAYNKYKDINEQRAIIETTYERIKAPLKDIIEEIENLKERGCRSNKPSLNYPTLDDYILSEGEQVLYTNYDIFGKDLSIYVFWAAFNDQFLNCRLKAISVLNVLKFQNDRILNGLKEFVNKEFFDFQKAPESSYGKLTYFLLLSDKEFYNQLREIIFYKNRVQILETQNDGTPKSTLAKSYKPISFEKKILTIVQLIKKPYSKISERFYFETNSATEVNITLNNEVELMEDSLSSTEYLLSCFSHSLRTDLPSNLNDQEKELINHYKNIAGFYKSFKQRFALTDSNGKEYFERTINFNENITVDELASIYNSISYVGNNDPILSNKVISFFQKLPEFSTSTHSLILEKIYQTFRGTFFETKEGRVNNGQSDNKRLIITRVFAMPDYKEVINLLFVPDYVDIENYQSHLKEEDIYLPTPGEIFSSDI